MQAPVRTVPSCRSAPEANPWIHPACPRFGRAAQCQAPSGRRIQDRWTLRPPRPMLRQSRSWVMCARAAGVSKSLTKHTKICRHVGHMALPCAVCNAGFLTPAAKILVPFLFLPRYTARSFSRWSAEMTTDHADKSFQHSGQGLPKDADCEAAVTDIIEPTGKGPSAPRKPAV